MHTTLPGAATGASFAALLRQLRADAGLTQEELAERAGLTATAVSALERGARTRPYPHTVRQLAAALGADDAARSALAASVPGRSAAATPSQPSPARRAHVLDVPGTPLFGRESEIEAVAAAVRARRLVTLTGTGGVGKTRLADAVARRVADDFPDGVFSVGLAPLASADEVLPAIARALAVDVAGGSDPLAEIAHAVAGRRLLLLLDNLEHLLAAAPQVAALVAACPTVVVLVTSRAPLRVREEAEHVVHPLDVPHDDTARAVEQSAAGALFLERARAVSPSFARSPGEAATVATLCRQLAGIPLALELAAARARVLDPTALLSRLDAAATHSAARDLPPRQQTMRATLDWSYELLTDGERRLFRRLAVLAGAFDLDAVEAIGGDGCLDELETLVEHSLVAAHVLGRYSMLEPVAQYARSLLLGEERADAQRAHALHHLALAEQAHDAYAHADQIEALAKVEQRNDDMVLALERSLAAGDGRTASRLCWELQRYWWFRARVSAGRLLCDRVVAMPGLEPADLAVASLAAGCTALALDDPAAARVHWTTAYGLADQVDDIGVVGHAVSGLALCDMVDGDLVAAADHLDVAQASAARGTRSCCAWVVSMCHIWRATLLRAAGDAEGARASAEHGLRDAGERGDRLTAYMALYSLGHGALHTGDHEEARRHLEAGLRLADETGDLLNVAHFAQSLEVVEVAAGEHARAAVLCGAADALLETFGAGGNSYRLLSREALAAARAAAREALGNDAYDDAVDTGRALPVEGLRDLFTPSSRRLHIVGHRRTTC